MDDLAARLRRSRPKRRDTDALIASVGRTAIERGLAEAAYAVLVTPFGPLLGVRTPRGLAALLHLRATDPETALDDVARRLSPRLVADPDGLRSVAEQLEAYLAGERRTFDLPVDWRLVGGAFARRVLEAARCIPYGQVATYGQVAAAAGNPRASRAAGNALGANPLPIVVPCHRVVRAGGGLGGYSGGVDVKRRLLALEGAPTG